MFFEEIGFDSRGEGFDGGVFGGEHLGEVELDAGDCWRKMESGRVKVGESGDADRVSTG